MASCLCSPSAIAAPELPGITVLAVSAIPVSGYEIPQTQVPNHGTFPPGTIDFCNVTVTYSHPQIEDQAIVEVWLPPKEAWNERILAVGGGGFITGRLRYDQMAGIVNENFATYTTDAGLASPLNPVSWALDDSGKIDEDMIEYWGHTSLGDMTAIGKSIVNSFYGKSPSYSYYTGCSMGGLQGYALAQRYPGDYDGIAAAAPAIRLHEIFMSWVWPQLMMNLAGEYPYGCEVDSLTAIAVAACDATDDVEDGIITSPDACEAFNPFDHVGAAAIRCSDPDNTPISKAAAYVANVTWTGIVDEASEPVFFAQHPGTDLTGITTPAGIAATTCKDVGEECGGAPLPFGPLWLQVFGLEDPSFPFEDLTLELFYSVLRGRKALFDQYVGSTDHDLSAFREAGGKMITFHGLADQTIPAGLVRDYYEQVLALDGDSADYFRYFEVPAMGHCEGLAHPNSTFDALRNWVENGVAPASLPFNVVATGGELNGRIACPYPQIAEFLPGCGDATSAECFACR
ncbi:Tannase/feruloyl esterase [Stachybotrys elegans]|uniref:Carboxylic ester hydrolase n=1 Tax=Stachybotrys elegans TaxID=80388 RepID=A0A8K0SPI1_9HYPO|nr:Tannase/feruloyl esterase [Stachybotrys elegans]